MVVNMVVHTRCIFRVLHESFDSCDFVTLWLEHRELDAIYHSVSEKPTESDCAELLNLDNTWKITKVETSHILPTKLCQTKCWKGMPSLYSTCETLISNQFWLTSSATGSWYSWISMPATHTQGTMNEILLGSNFVASQVIDDMNIQRSTDKLLNHVEFQCCFAKLSACSSELANCLQIFYRWMPYQRACRAFQCIDHFLETGRTLWTYSLYLDQLPFTVWLEWLWSCRPVLCVFRQEFGKCIDFFFFCIFCISSPDVELLSSRRLQFLTFLTEICCEDRNILKKKHIEAWKMKDPAWWYNIVEEWILAYIIYEIVLVLSYTL